jgi:alkylhydroperoxidase family enzyme
MGEQHLSYVDPASITDPDMIAEMERCAREGTPRPESQAIRAHVPAVFRSFAESWKTVFREGVCDHDIKELCRVYVSRSVKCEYCGNQRSEKSRAKGMSERAYDDLLMFRKSDLYDDRQKAALEYADAIMWNNPDDEDAMWERLHKHFSEPELVELGYFIALTLGQQSWLRTLNIEHHQIKPGSAASMAPGMENAHSLKKSKSADNYWARR